MNKVVRAGGGEKRASAAKSSTQESRAAPLNYSISLLPLHTSAYTVQCSKQQYGYVIIALILTEVKVRWILHVETPDDT